MFVVAQQRGFVIEFLAAFDPDTVTSAVRLLPNRLATLLLEIASRLPATEDHWAKVAVDQSAKASALRESLGNREPSLQESWQLNDREKRHS